MRKPVWVSLVVATVALSGCAYGPSGGRVGETGQVQVLTASSLPEPGPADFSTASRGYVIGPLDELVLDVFDIESLTNREINVDTSGNIAVPIAGSIPAAGRTPAELADAIAERLRAGYVRNPQVSVNVKTAVSQAVTVDGQVTQPGIYPILGDMTLIDAVASAKGLSEFAKLDDVVVLRTVNGQRYAGVYNIAAIRRGNYPDPQIYANDVVVVGDSPQLRRMKDLIAVLPAITSPLIYLLDGNN
jgi:polysaccharide export outer membrane protein